MGERLLSLRTQPRVSTLIIEHNSSAGAGDSPVHHSIAQKASLNRRTEHSLEAYATLTPSRRQRGFTAIDRYQDGCQRSLNSPENQLA
jgi:hypothetical protein